ncbi:restriction endonuclease subunit S, partial [Helicobacter ganmani]|uniref:restriction endonuclease subunit S n=1 Tax=Helicobacter ganmani TaxID=60246 RepID=UPI003A8C140A
VKFMAFQIRNKAQNFIVSSRGTTINGITKDTLKKVALKIPPLATQNQIVQILESKFTHLDNLAQFVNASLENLQRLKSSLLNQAFKGELV